MRNLHPPALKGGPLSVVCFGASAGGLEAYRKILSLLPPRTPGLAFIVVHHQPAEGKTLLTEILPGVTRMPVVLIADGDDRAGQPRLRGPCGKAGHDGR
jgi:two-component system, chemotaxis family, CheB/CheR fusion protein